MSSPRVSLHVGIAPPPLLAHERNVASGSGEDGILAWALERLGDTDGWCCEFGAWDGRTLSNTWALIAERGYRAVLIEADASRYEALRRTHGGREGVIALRCLVGWEGPDRLDALLAATPIPADFDLLSIDVDGNDYHVWEAVFDYRPKLVVCEYNPTIPNEVDFVQARDPAVAQGASLRALVRLGEAKGYRLIHATVVNAIFVRAPLWPRLGLPDTDFTALRADLSQLTYLFQTYDGRLHTAGYERVRWHDVPLRARHLRVVPRWLAGFPGEFTGARRLAWRAWRLCRDPARRRRRLG